MITHHLLVFNDLLEHAKVTLPLYFLCRLCSFILHPDQLLRQGDSPHSLSSCDKETPPTPSAPASRRLALEFDFLHQLCKELHALLPSSLVLPLLLHPQLPGLSGGSLLVTICRRIDLHSLTPLLASRTWVAMLLMAPIENAGIRTPGWLSPGWMT